MTQLLLATALVVVANYLNTAYEPSTLNYHDKILEMRREVRETAKQEAEEDTKQEFSQYRKGGQGQGRNMFLDRRATTREKYVRRLLENMFRHKFPSVKPAWLLNPKTGRRMEIDCYCKEMRLGVEIDGEQHHKYIPYFHKKGYREFQDMKERDMVKSALMKKQGVRLVRLPYTVLDAPSATIPKSMKLSSSSSGRGIKARSGTSIESSSDSMMMRSM